ncbi:hypothetical protein P9F86_11820 [Bacillus altitudinis]|uniref:TolB family protein n=1 Tax=Bacillus altitudinis TaxID=293387 RepID=UPI002DBE56C9|nr:hypothetical protein [Bacillus altitudinis]MEC2039546.1 hypothetical protein [Bacillus altitudinis]
MKKSTWWIITVIGVAVIAAVIFFMMKPGQEAEHAGKVKTNQDAKDELLVSFTDQKLNNTYYLHDKALHTEKLTAYPSIAYDQAKQLLYYTYTDEDTQKVSIRELNVKTDKEKTLFTSDDSIDSMRLSGDGKQLYLRYNKDSGEQFYVAFFDLKTQKVKVLYPEKSDDDTVSSFAYDPASNLLAIQHYSLKEDYKKTDEANEKGMDPEPTTMKITLQTGEKGKRIARISQTINDISFSPDHKKLIYTEVKVRNEKEVSSIKVMDVDTGKTKTLVKNSQDVRILSAAQPQFSADGTSVYFLGVAKNAKELKDDTGRKAKVRTIFEYDIKKKTVETAWEKEGGIVNNFTVNR